MAGDPSVWVPLGILCPLLLAAAAVECSEKETLLQPMPSGVTPPTDCLMECTAMTYIRKLQLQDDRNIRLKDSAEGALGEHCWPAELRCTVGESFHSAFVVLPVDASAPGHEQLDVRAADPSSGALQVDGGPATLDDGCGLRYDVTQHFSTQTAAAGTSFCIRVGVPEDDPGDRILRCPPYLVTFWMRKKSVQQDGG